MLGSQTLKFVSTVFFLVCFLNLKQSTCESRKNVFFILLQKLFLFSRKSNFKILDIKIWKSHQMSKQNNKYILTYNLGSKYSLLMKFGHLMSYYKRKKIIKIFCKNCNLKTSSRSFFVCKEWSISSIVKWNFWDELLIVYM